MTKNYYRSEYSDKQWKALIDKATELGCQITYSKYGNIVTIDSTDRESSIMETNRSKFESHGYIINSIAEKLEIQISQSGDAARYQSTIRWSSRGTEVIHGRWQEIRYSKRNNSPYITMFGKRLYLTNFMRNDYGRR